MVGNGVVSADVGATETGAGVAVTGIGAVVVGAPIGVGFGAQAIASNTVAMIAINTMSITLDFLILPSPVFLDCGISLRSAVSQTI